MLVSSVVALAAYGCVAAPAEGDDGRDDGLGGTGALGGTGQGGAAGTVAGTSGTGVGGATPTGGTPGLGGAAPTGGAPPQGGSAGVGTGGTMAGTGTSGTAGTPAGGSGGAPPQGGAGPVGGAGTGPGGTGAGGVNSDAACMGIKSNMACTPEGQMCPELPCGLGDTGRRSCNCVTNWTCMSCSFVNSPIATKPAGAETACVGVTEGMPCAAGAGMAESVCKSTVVTTEYCMCAVNPRMPTAAPEWDCDSPPNTW